jgi:hypothetical protein
LLATLSSEQRTKFSAPSSKNNQPAWSAISSLSDN